MNLLNELTDDQKRAIEKLHKLKVGALFMKQGSGKTRVALTLVKSTKVKQVLFICPCSTKDNLIAEIERWGLDREYRVVGYETIASSDRTYLELLDWVGSNDTFIVADESVFIKNETSKRFSRAINLADKCEYRLILNGTPVTKNEWDIYNQMQFLSPKIIGMSRDEFLNAFFTRIRFKRKNSSVKEFYKLSEVNIDYLKAKIAPYIYECDLNLELTECVERILIFASDNARDSYTYQKELLINALRIGECKVEMFTNLALACFLDDSRIVEIAKYVREFGQSIVFCTLLKEVEIISERVDCFVITGATPIDERNRIIQEFKNSNKPLVMTIGTGAFGLNLQFCTHLAFASLTFDYGKIDQAKMRIKRLGQERAIKYTYFTSDLGVYNLIEDNIQKKQSLHDLIIESLESDFDENIL